MGSRSETDCGHCSITKSAIGDASYLWPLMVSTEQVKIEFLNLPWNNSWNGFA
jgi:hypothetical protein